jgi:hypothetical protein
MVDKFCATGFDSDIFFDPNRAGRQNRDMSEADGRRNARAGSEGCKVNLR